MSFRLSFAIATLLFGAAARPAYSATPLQKLGHFVTDIFVGRDPEKAVLIEQAKLEQAKFEDGTRALAQRFADLTLCVPSQAKDGKKSSTLSWYFANTIAGWSDSLLADFNPSAGLKFSGQAFERAFLEAASVRLGRRRVPTSLRDLARALGQASIEVARHARETETRFNGSPSAIRSASAQTRARLDVMIRNHYATLSNLSPNCADRRRGSDFYRTPRFHHGVATLEDARKREQIEARAAEVYNSDTTPIPSVNSLGTSQNSSSHRGPATSVAPEEPESLKPSKGLLTALSETPSENTQALLDIAHDGSKVRRNEKRVIVGSKQPWEHLEKGRCAMYVSIALSKAGCLPDGYRAPGAVARNMTTSLTQNHGFVNLLKDGQLPKGMKSLKDVPPGAVIVYSHDNPKRAGHVEIKLRHGFVSDYRSDNPVTDREGSLRARGYRVTGILVKPSCGAGEIP